MLDRSENWCEHPNGSSSHSTCEKNYKHDRRSVALYESFPRRWKHGNNNSGKSEKKKVAIRSLSWSEPHLLREDGNSYILCWVGIIASRSTDSSDRSRSPEYRYESIMWLLQRLLYRQLSPQNLARLDFMVEKSLAFENVMIWLGENWLKHLKREGNGNPMQTWSFPNLLGLGRPSAEHYSKSGDHIRFRSWPHSSFLFRTTSRHGTVLFRTDVVIPIEI